MMKIPNTFISDLMSGRNNDLKEPPKSQQRDYLAEETREDDNIQSAHDLYNDDH